MAACRRFFRRFAADTAGNMAILFAVGFSLAAVAAAFSVDEISLYHERRVAQSTVDMAALTAARSPADGLPAARQVLVDAGLVGATVSVGDLTAQLAEQRLEVTPGRYLPDTALAAELRFVPGQSPYNAVRVRYRAPGHLWFSQGWGARPVISVEAIAAVAPQVAFSVGSRVAALSGGLPAAVLNGLLGSNVNLTALDYNALLSADVSLFGFLDALAQQLSVRAVTYNDLLNARASRGQVTAALATLLAGTERTAMAKLAAAAGSDGMMRIGDLVGLGRLGEAAIGTGSAVAMAKVSAMNLVTASAAIADGQHQVALGLSAGVPSLTSLSLSLAVGEPMQFAPWFTVGDTGSVVRTAQVRLRFTAQLAGGAVLLGAGVRLPIYVEVAPAEAAVQSASCPQGQAVQGSAVIAARPGLIRAAVGDVGDAAFSNFGAFPAPGVATILNVTLLRITASALTEVAQIAPVALEFSPADIAARKIRTAKTTTPVQSLVASLIGNTTLTVNVLGIGLSSPAVIKAAVRTLITPVGPVLDATIATVLQALGLSLGEADVRVYGVRCGGASLVG